MELAEYAKDVIPHLKNVEAGFPLFWYNANHHRGFKLTKRGFEILIERKYPSWFFHIPYTSWTNSYTILLDQKALHPWYLDRMGVTFFYEQLASAMALSNNNVDTAVNLVYC